jgi:hypothetical protein
MTECYIYKKMNFEIYQKLVVAIEDELAKEHPDEEVDFGDVAAYLPWNKFAVSLTDLGFKAPDDFDDTWKNVVVDTIAKKIKDRFPFLEVTYEVPTNVSDGRHYIYKHLKRLGNSEHYNIVLLLN